jgi:MoxR-like ATPase
MGMFSSVEDTRARLAATGYLVDDRTATVTFLADVLGKPLLLEGPAGTGKTELAKAVAAATGAELVRLQCYEGLDEARALYEWNYRKQLLRIQMAQGSAAGGGDWDEVHADIFGEDYLLARPLLRAIRRQDPTVLLIDETDKADVEVEGLLLEVLSDFQVTIPELGTITAANRPFVVLTSNATRELSEALRRRCLYDHVGYPDAERERAIVLARVPEASERLAAHVVGAVRALRGMGLRKPPSVAESIDWARTVLALGLDTLDDATAAATLGVVLKHDADHARAADALGIGSRA